MTSALTWAQKQILFKIDPNQDGKITPQERKKVIESLKQKQKEDQKRITITPPYTDPEGVKKFQEEARKAFQEESTLLGQLTDKKKPKEIFDYNPNISYRDSNGSEHRDVIDLGSLTLNRRRGIMSLLGIKAVQLKEGEEPFFTLMDGCLSLSNFTLFRGDGIDARHRCQDESYPYPHEIYRWKTDYANLNKGHLDIFFKDETASSTSGIASASSQPAMAMTTDFDIIFSYEILAKSVKRYATELTPLNIKSLENPTFEDACKILTYLYKYKDWRVEQMSPDEQTEIHDAFVIGKLVPLEMFAVNRCGPKSPPKILIYDLKDGKIKELIVEGNCGDKPITKEDYLRAIRSLSSTKR